LALNTAKAGYLTRKLVDVSQDVVIHEEDCGDREGKHITEEHILGFDSGIGKSIRGRVLAKDLVDTKGAVIFKKGHLVTREDASHVESLGIKEAHVRTPLTCKAVRGLCQLCYGEDPGRGVLVSKGEPVGIVAAQAIGEPGTQLTMQTKHAGGVTSGGDIVGGLPRVEEIFERRNPKNPAVISEVNGEVLEVKNDGRELSINVLIDVDSRKKGSKDASVTYTAPAFRTALIKRGDKVTKGQLLTDGSAEIATLFKLAGRAKAEDYIIRESNAIYELQGVSIARKHIEIIIRQMFSRRKIKNPGDTRFTTGEVIEYVELVEANIEVAKKDGEEATAEQILLGITEAALSTSSFLSAVSFQHAVRILIDTAVKGGLDKLRGLKENVIIGRLIPAGTGLKAKEFAPEEIKLEEQEA
jgi:DNA-directed RNA polymerase subunit beta'